MRVPLRRRPGETARGQATLVGYLLILSIVIIGSAGIVYFGSAALTDLRGTVNTQNAEHAMREADARLSQVAFSANDAHTLDFGALDGEAHVTQEGSMRVTMRNGTHTCAGDLAFGSIEVAAADGDRVVYQAGGVWKMTDHGGVMLSPPNMQYAEGTLSFQLVNVTGGVEGPISTLQASKDTAESQTKSELYRTTFGNPDCNPPENVTVTVDSQFYRAWGTFFRDHFSDGTVTVDDADGTASIRLESVGSTATVNDGDNTVSTDANVTATVEVVGTELSGRYESGGDWHKINGPTTFRVVVDDTARTPWYDGDIGDSIAPEADDLNDPTKGESFEYTFQETGGVNVSVEATSYGCNDYDPTGVTNTYDGTEYVEDRCDDVGSPDIQISSTSNSDNLAILKDGDRVPDFTEAGSEQRNLTEILGEKIDGDGYLQLKRNEFVFLFELSEQNADPADASGGGDPDYNDAVVVLTITEAGTVGAPENFAIHVSVNEVTVTRK